MRDRLISKEAKLQVKDQSVFLSNQGYQEDMNQGSLARLKTTLGERFIISKENSLTEYLRIIWDKCPI